LSFIKKLLYRLLKKLEKRCFNWSSKILVKSVLMKKELNKLYLIPNSKIVVVSGGFDEKDFPEISIKNYMDIKKKILGKNSSKKVILFVGRIVPAKGLIFLIRALPNILLKNKAKLLILGDQYFGKYRKIIDKEIKKLGLENDVIFLGKKNQREVYKYFSIADTVVIPSVYEPFGMVLIQALNYNLPVVVSKKIGSLENLKNNKKIKIIDPHSIKEISNSVNYLLKNKNKKKSPKILIKTWKEVINEIEEVMKPHFYR